MPCRTVPGKRRDAVRWNQRSPRNSSHATAESDARPITSAIRKSTPTCGELLNHPAIAPMPASIAAPIANAATDSFQRFHQRSRPSVMLRRRITPGRTRRIRSNGGSVNSMVVSRPMASPCSDGAPAERQIDVELEIAVDEMRKNALHAVSCDDAQHRAGRAQNRRLERVDADHLRRSRAHRLHDGDAVQVLLQVRVHGHGHAQCADNQCDQADDAEECGRVVQARVMVGLVSR